MAILLYRNLPAYETNHNQLILLQMDPNHVKTLKGLKIVQALFKIEANIDSHMERDNDVDEILTNKEVCVRPSNTTLNNTKRHLNNTVV